MATLAAVTVVRDGRPVIAHYGSVATEVAVCVKHAGVIERPELAVLELEGDAGWLEHALGESAPAPGRAARAGSAWCARPDAGRAMIVGPAGALGGWRRLARRSAIGGVRGSCRDAAGLVARSLIGPRAARILADAGVAGPFAPATARHARVGGAPVVVLCEAAGRFLILADARDDAAAARALHAAGASHGLARIGHDAYDRLAAAGRPRVLAV